MTMYLPYCVILSANTTSPVSLKSSALFSSCQTTPVRSFVINDNDKISNKKNLNEILFYTI